MELIHRRWALSGLRRDSGVDDDRPHRVPMRVGESGAQQQTVGTPACSGFPPPADRERGNQPQGKLVNQNQVTMRAQHPRAFGEAAVLIRPMVERRAADHEVGPGIRVGQLLGDSGGERQSWVVGEACCCLDHVGGGVNSGECLSFWIMASQSSQEVSGAASDIEDACRRAHRRCRQRRGPVADGVMLTSAPTLVVTRSTIVVCADIAIGWHSGNFRTRPAISLVYKRDCQGGEHSAVDSADRNGHQQPHGTDR